MSWLTVVSTRQTSTSHLSAEGLNACTCVRCQESSVAYIDLVVSVRVWINLFQSQQLNGPGLEKAPVFL